LHERRMMIGLPDWPALGAAIGLNTHFSQADVWHPTYHLILPYVIAVFILKRIYSDEDGTPCASKHQTSVWKPIMVVYNLALSVFSFGIFVETIGFLRRTEPFTDNCMVVANDKRFESAVYVFFISKYVEYADTLFLIVKGKNVSFLHFFHHIFAALSMGLVYTTHFEGAWIFSLLNGFVHGIMYFYYLCALLKIRLPGKRYITIMQLSQFVIGLTILWFYKYVPCLAAHAGQSLTWCFFWFFVGLLIVLFLNFYVQTFLRGGAAKDGKAKKA
jgi:hypothetical protein